MERKAKIRIVLAVVLAAFSIFTVLAVLSYSSTDPGCGDWRGGGRVANWCGAVGAYFSGFLMLNFGRIAGYVAAGLVVFWTYLLFSSREKLPDAYLKLFGSAVLILSVSAVTALVGMGHYFSSAVGTFIARRTMVYFGGPGAFVLLAVVAALSLLLATDFVVVRPAGMVALAVYRVARAAVTKLFIVKPWRRKEGQVCAVPAGRATLPATPKPEFEVRKKPSAPPAAVTRAPIEVKRPAGPPVELKRPEPAATPEAKRPEPPSAAEKDAEAAPAGPKPLPIQTKPAAAAPKPRPTPEERKAAEGTYVFPPAALLDDQSPDEVPEDDDYIKEKARVLEETLAEFAVAAKVVGVETGPTITQYELELAPGIKVNRVHSLTDDIAMALKAPSVRIVAPIPGRDSVGVEVPNSKKAIVRLKSLLEERPADKAGAVPIYLGRDAQGEALVADLTELPHLLIAGATGAGKSVCINSVILSVLTRRHPDDVKLLLVDPKMVELSAYRDVPHLICPVVTDMKQASTILEWACMQMDNRYDYLAAANVRHISRYNKLGPEGLRERLNVPRDAQIEIPDKMPYIIIIIDELADLMMVAAKEIETFITRLAQKSRAVGLHLVLATQRPSVDVITGLIKSNLPARLSFKVSSRIDSRTILDQNGAEKLLGRGDMLFLPPATAKLVRAQGTYVTDDEIRRVVEYAKAMKRPDYDEELVAWKKAERSEEGLPAESGEPGERDPLYDEAVRIVIENQRGSVSLLQRRLEIGYSRSARLIDFMAENGILGPYKGSQAREVLFTPEQWEEMEKEARTRAR